MIRNGWRLRATLLLAGVAGALIVAAIGRLPGLAYAGRPDFVVIQTDDQTARMLHSTWIDRRGKRHLTMPRTLSLIGGQGVEFSNYYATVPVCSPARSALLSGQYGHTSGLVRNVGRLGGAEGLAASEVWSRNIAVALRRAGYRTAHFGRLVNGYGSPDAYNNRQVPPGWSTWATDWTPGPVRRFYGYRLNVDGRIQGPFGRANYQARSHKDSPDCPTGGLACEYHTDQITTRAVRAIRKAHRRPVYVQIDFQAPHGNPGESGKAEPASRHIGSAARTPLPRPPGFNEANISDKPPALRHGSRRLTRREIRRLRQQWQDELEALRSVDESVGRVIRTLRRSGRLKDTYIFFTSDNGAFFGEHRYARSKFLAYEPSANVPLIVRGPGVKRDRRSAAIVSNVDIAPTIADLANVRPLLRQDGRSIGSLLRSPGRSGRRAVVIESYRLPSQRFYRHLREEGIQAPNDLGASVSATVPAVNFTALRAGRYKYIEYEGGGRELYDLTLDPAEISNRVRWPAYRRVRKILRRQIGWRRFCAGRTCRRGTGRLPAPQFRVHPPDPGRRPGNGGGAGPGGGTGPGENR